MRKRKYWAAPNLNSALVVSFIAAAGAAGAAGVAVADVAVVLVLGSGLIGLQLLMAVALRRI